jgi:hypothetical protein
MFFFIVERLGRGRGNLGFQNHYGTGERVQVDFFSSFFIVEGEGGGGQCFFIPLFDMWKEEGKGMILVPHFSLVSRPYGCRKIFGAYYLCPKYLLNFSKLY